MEGSAFNRTRAKQKTGTRYGLANRKEKEHRSSCQATYIHERKRKGEKKIPCDNITMKMISNTIQINFTRVWIWTSPPRPKAIEEKKKRYFVLCYEVTITTRLLPRRWTSNQKIQQHSPVPSSRVPGVP